MNRKFFLLVALLSISIFYTSVYAQGQKTFSVMTYNIENFFDTFHDHVIHMPDGKKIHTGDFVNRKILEKVVERSMANGGVAHPKFDYTYLPKSVKEGRMKDKIQEVCEAIPVFPWRRDCYNMDWSPAVFKIKLRNILFALQYKKNLCGSDIIMLQEIENKRVLFQIAKSLPKHCGYKHIGLIEGEDKRGIDLAYISRFPRTNHRLIKYPQFPDDKKRRDLYHVDFNVYGKKVSIVANHWPSMGTKDMQVRMRAAKILGKFLRESEADLTLAVGDFNTSEHKEKPIYTYLKRYLRDAIMMGSGANMPGSHYYKNKWEFLDRIFVSKKSFGKPTNTIKPLWNTFYVVNKGLLWDRDIRNKAGNIKYRKGTPRRFSDYFKSGFSDHLPLTMTFQVL